MVDARLVPQLAAGIPLAFIPITEVIQLTHMELDTTLMFMVSIKDNQSQLATQLDARKVQSLTAMMYQVSTLILDKELLTNTEILDFHKNHPFLLATQLDARRPLPLQDGTFQQCLQRSMDSTVSILM